MDYIDSLRIEGVDYGISQIKDEGVNKITSLSDIPVDKRTIYATLSEDVTGISVSSGMVEGDTINIICNPIVDIKILMSGSGIVPVIEDNLVIDAKKSEIFLITIVKKGSDYLINTTGKVINSLGFSEIAESGDVLVWNKLYSTSGFITYEQLCTIEEDSKSLYIPIGVCAIPSSHNVFGNGKAGVIGLKEDTSKSWCTNSLLTDTVLKNYTSYPALDKEGNFLEITTIPNLVFPSDIFFDIISTDGETGYSLEGKNPDTINYIPSPFNKDKSRNKFYYSGDNNVFSDFNGKDNTKTLIGLGEDYEAAIWCNNYIVNNVVTDKWYLPSTGEMGYVSNKASTINRTIQKIIEIFGEDVADNLSLPKAAGELASPYWTSTEVNDRYSALIFLGYGVMSYPSSFIKSSKNYVRPFLQVDPRQKFPENINIEFNISPQDMTIRYSINTEDYDQILNYSED